MSDELKEMLPCPFCGCEMVAAAEVGTDINVERWAVSCADCFALGPDTESEAEADKQWNTRAARDSEDRKCGEETCSFCNGKGAVRQTRVNPLLGFGFVNCPDCDGTGSKPL